MMKPKIETLKEKKQLIGKRIRMSLSNNKTGELWRNFIPRQKRLINSDFMIDDRPHFEIMDERYKSEDPDSEEELWIPIRPEV